MKVTRTRRIDITMIMIRETIEYGMPTNNRRSDEKDEKKDQNTKEVPCTSIMQCLVRKQGDEVIQIDRN